jgi:hypothetical protein
MEPSCSKKCGAADLNPLRQPDILQHVLSYVPGEWLFLSTVCSWWRERYAKLSAITVAKTTDRAAYKSIVVCVPQTTLCSSAFASPSRLRLAHQHGLELTAVGDQFAAGRHADIDTLLAAHELGMAYGRSVLLGAARAGAVPRVQWLYTICEPFDERTNLLVVSQAARAGSKPVLKWLKQQGVVFHENACLHAAQYNHLSTLQYLRSEGCRWDASVLSAAARNGAFELLRWAVEHGCPWAEYVVDADNNFVLAQEPDEVLNSILADAAFGGSIELLEWLKQQLPELQYNESVMLSAAAAGQTAMCDYLYTDGCPWTSEACEMAGFYDHDQTLRWLREHGCPFDAAAVAVKAADRGMGVKVIAYLFQQGLLDAALLTQMLRVAGAMNNLAVVQWLRQHGAEWPAVLRNEALPQSWHGPTLAWARAEGCASPLQ